MVSYDLQVILHKHLLRTTAASIVDMVLLNLVVDVLCSFLIKFVML